MKNILNNANNLKIFSFLLVFAFFSIIIFPSISAVCTVTLNANGYVNGELVTAEISCDDSNEKEKEYTFNWTNSSGYQLEIDSGTTPETISQAFFESFVLDSNHSGIYGGYINGTMDILDTLTDDSAFVNESTAQNLILEEINITTTNFLGKTFGLSAKVKNNTEDGVSGAICRIDIEDEDGNPITAKQSISNYLGDLHEDFDIDAKHFNEGLSYIADINCFCNAGTNYKCDVAPAGAGGHADVPFLVDDLGDKVKTGKWRNDSGFFADFTTGSHLYPAVWMVNEFGGKTLIEENPTRINQEGIVWKGFNSTLDFNLSDNGQGFITASRPASLCFLINNSFATEEIINVRHLNFDDDTHEFSFFPEALDTKETLLGDRISLRTGIKPSTDDGIVEKCTEEFLIPSHLIGGNDWDANFQIEVEGFEQLLEVESDEFSIFGQRIGKGFVDFLTINTFNFTSSNATEGQFIQTLLNITTNHPDLSPKFRFKYTMVGNRNITVGTARIIETESLDFPNEGSVDGNFFLVGVLPTAREILFTSPRFRVPNGLVDRDLYDVIGMAFAIEFGEKNNGIYSFETVINSTAVPEIKIVGKEFDIVNLTTSAGFNNDITACTPIEYEFEYDDVISNISVTPEEEEEFIAKFCVRDLDSIHYLSCNEFIIDSDNEVGGLGNFTTLVPYVSTEGTINASMDVWIYEYVQKGHEGDCPNCGELVDFTHTDGSNFNIVSNQSESCKNQDSFVDGADKMLRVLQAQREATEGIESKTGLFQLGVDCPTFGQLGGDMDCIIKAQLEDTSGGLQEEVKFDCYILENGQNYSQLSFNKMINTTLTEITKTFAVPSANLTKGDEATLQCYANYYAGLGGRTDSFFDTFIPDDNVGVDGRQSQFLSKIADKIEDTIEVIKDEITRENFFKYLIIFGLVFFLIVCISIGIIYAVTKEPKN